MTLTKAYRQTTAGGVADSRVSFFMQVRVLYFGVLKDLLHREGEQMQLPPAASVETLLRAIREKSSGSARLWETLAVAVNQEYATSDLLLHEGDEVALLPPVSGGLASGRAGVRP
jgi:molybdopterin converting factor subunit 1